MDYATVARELVRSLRGTRSQAACARRLRCTSNVLHAWEHGTRYPALAHVDALCSLAGRNLHAALVKLGGESAGTCGAPDFPSVLRALAAQRPLSEIASQMGKSRNTLARWLDGRTEPRLPDLLCYVQTTTLRLLELLEDLVDPRSLPSVLKSQRDLAAQRKLAYAMPWSHAVLRALELGAYQALPKHKRGYLAKTLGITLARERACLRALEASGQIRREAGKWQPLHVITVDTRPDRAGNLSLKKHWACLAAERFRRDEVPEESLFSYNLFAVSDEGLAEIRALHLAYFAQLRAVVERCRAPTQLVLANIQLMPFRGMPAIRARKPRSGP